MNRKLILTVALASAFAVPMTAAYAEGDEDKKSDSQLILSEGDEKKSDSQLILSEGDEKKSDSQLILSEDDEKKSDSQLIG